MQQASPCFSCAEGACRGTQGLLLNKAISSFWHGCFTAKSPAKVDSDRMISTAVLSDNMATATRCRSPWCPATKHCCSSNNHNDFCVATTHRLQATVQLAMASPCSIWCHCLTRLSRSTLYNVIPLKEQHNNFCGNSQSSLHYPCPAPHTRAERDGDSCMGSCHPHKLLVIVTSV